MEKKRSRVHSFLSNRKFVNSKRSQSAIIASVLIILIVIVAIIIVWNIVFPLVREKSQEVNVNQFSINLQINSVKLFANGVAWVNIKRNSGVGDIDGLRFVFYDENGNSASADKEKINELETKDYEFSPLPDLGKIKRIVVAPIINNRLGMSNELEAGNSIEIPARVVGWWKSDGNGGFSKYYSDESLTFYDQMAISFWSNGDGEIKTNSSFYLIQINNNKVNFSYSGNSFKSDYDTNEGWNHLLKLVFELVYFSLALKGFKTNLCS